jgi:formylglycine-generating enzyme required for sulfatase activity
MTLTYFTTIRPVDARTGISTVETRGIRTRDLPTSRSGVNSVLHICRTKTKSTAVFVLFLLLGLTADANNITVSNLSLSNENRLENYTFVTFDLTWENSWRLNTGAANWDAAWVFVKYRIGNGEWQHANLHNTEHNVGTGTPATITTGLLDDNTAFDATTNPGMGVFVYRSSASFGTFTSTGIQLRWDYGADGITGANNIDVKVFAIEMVRVQAGAFNVGGGGGNNAFTSTTINTPDATTAPSGSGALGGAAGGYPTGQTAPANASWPNGYNAFYCMKYEVTQQQYVDFLNTLTQTQANTRKYNSSAWRYSITGSAVGSYLTTLKYVACDMSWADGAAYSDWSGLRPMTELEFEKACRGDQVAVNGEYAWGTAGIASSAYSLSNAGSTSEGIATNYSTTVGNARYANTVGYITGPVRVGIFAANGSNTGRVSAGASYWGIMELSGNLFERIVSIVNLMGRSFTGVHGDGLLDSNGNANPSNWPSFDAEGAGFRGGHFNANNSELRVSDRYYSGATDPGRFGSTGFRAVRS